MTDIKNLQEQNKILGFLIQLPLEVLFSITSAIKIILFNKSEKE